ncbi:hypothetical protein BHM03_00061263, partial [Ensete ventricosum]
MVSKTGSSCDDWLMDCVCNVGSRKIVLRGLIVPEDACREAACTLGHEGSAHGQIACGRGWPLVGRSATGVVAHGQVACIGCRLWPRAAVRRGNVPMGTTS